MPDSNLPYVRTAVCFVRRYIHTVHTYYTVHGVPYDTVCCAYYKTVLRIHMYVCTGGLRLFEVDGLAGEQAAPRERRREKANGGQADRVPEAAA